MNTVQLISLVGVRYRGDQQKDAREFCAKRSIDSMWLFGTCFPTSQSHFSPTNGVVRIDASGFDRTRGSKYDTKRAKLAIQQLKE